MNFQIKILQQKSEKTEGEKADVSKVLELKAEQVSTKIRLTVAKAEVNHGTNW